MVDANGNRVAEGLRVLEDLARFVVDTPDLQRDLRNLRHRLAEILAPFGKQRLRFRNSGGDSGFEVSRQSGSDRRKGTLSLVRANSCRAEEGLRALEESLKTLGFHGEGKGLETLRQTLYDLEKRLVNAAARYEKPPFPGGLYGLTGEAFSLGRKNAEVIRLLVEGGVKIIQYREKKKPVREKLAECRELRRITRNTGALLIVNDDPLLALETDADGVHIGQDDYPPALVRSIVGPDRIIGLSTHDPGQAAAAVKEDIDYIGVGPIFPTRTKEDVCGAVGLEYLTHVVRTHAIPFVAIGGINGDNLPDVVRAGARTVAMVTSLVGAEDIARTVRHFNHVMEMTINENR
jgi:thiamine-phosphate pyrophosphorylase